MYDPGTARWMSMDPMGMNPASDVGFDPMAAYGDGPNLYQYVRSNPMLFVDPSGMHGSTWHECGGERWLDDTRNPKYGCCNGVKYQQRYAGKQCCYNGRVGPCRFPDGNLDVNALVNSLQAKCPQCSDCLRKLVNLNGFNPQCSGRNQCVQWVDQFMNFSHARPDICDCEKQGCYTLSGQYWEYPIGVPGTGWWLGHMAVKVTLCDGSVFYIDNGWWGDDDHFFEKPSPIVTPYP